MKSFAFVFIASCFSLGSLAISVFRVGNETPITRFVKQQGLDPMRAKIAFLKLTPEERHLSMVAFNRTKFAKGVDSSTMFEKMITDYKTTGMFALAPEHCPCLTWKEVFNVAGSFHQPKGLDCKWNELGGFGGDHFCDFVHHFQTNLCLQSEFGPESDKPESVCYVDTNCARPVDILKPVLRKCQAGRDEMLRDLSIRERENLAHEMKVDTGVLSMYSSVWVDKGPNDLSADEVQAVKDSGVPTYFMKNGGKSAMRQDRFAVKGKEVWRHHYNLLGGLSRGGDFSQKWLTTCEAGCPEEVL